MASRKKITAAVLLTGVAALAAFTGYRVSQAYQKNEKKPAKSNPIVVNMVMAEKLTMRDERSYSGTVWPWSSFDIDPKVSGKLIKLNFDIGDAIRRGDQIVKIDDLEYIQQLHQAEASLELARAKSIEAAELLKLRTNEYHRQQQLREKNATTQASFESAESTMKAQQATAAMCEAEVKSCEAQVANARLRVADTSISADWKSGSDTRYVGERYVDEGTLIATGKPILQILELDRVKIYVQVIERDYPYLRSGQQTTVFADAYPGRKFTGTVTNIANALSEKTRNALAVIAVPNSDLSLRPGMFVRVQVVLAEHKDTQAVPPNALMTRDNRQGIFCYDRPSGTAEFVPVETGLATRDRVEIVSPKLTKPVITVGNHLLEPGKAVEISELSRGQLVESLYRKDAEPPAAASPGESAENGGRP